MIIKYEKVKKQNISSVKDSERKNIIEYLKGLVDEHCQEKPDEWFATRDLVGGDNSDWRGTPLQQIYENRCDEYKSGGHATEEAEKKAVSQAGKDVGRVLKEMLLMDERIFVKEDGFRGTCYLLEERNQFQGVITSGENKGDEFHILATCRQLIVA